MAVFMDDVAQMLSDKAVEMGKVCKVHVKVDTGMTSIGMADRNGRGNCLCRQVKQASWY